MITGVHHGPAEFIFVILGFIVFFVVHPALGAALGAYFGRKLAGSSQKRGALWGGTVGVAVFLGEAACFAYAPRFIWLFSPWPLGLLVANAVGAGITYWICRQQGRRIS